ncbi:hypothetical protein LUZ60_003308 [Juncus effusus]|nr:hypothetical protein LUZ60_003308 [Juncus effusus]
MLDHSSFTAGLVSFSVFSLFAVLAPVLTSLSISSNNDNDTTITFNRIAQVPTSSLATIAFITLTVFFRRQEGLRRILFLEGGLRRDSSLVRHRYALEIDKSFRRHLALILLPSLSLELVHKMIFFSSARVCIPFFPNMTRVDPWIAVVFVITIVSWVYRTGVFLLVCVLFRLTCELQILRFEGFYEMFDVESSQIEWIEAIFREHARIKRQLLETSHRYRVFIIGCIITITVSQLGSLLIVFASKSPKDFSNSGDLVVCSVVQLSGFFMCLLGAARITHRAQRVVSIASKWHIAMSCCPNRKFDVLPTRNRPENDGYISDYEHHVNLTLDESIDSNLLFLSPEAALASRTRQALVTYLQYNSGGITLFGFALDRGLLHILFAFEMTLVLWILSKV